jgi:hypothetical protein
MSSIPGHAKAVDTMLRRSVKSAGIEAKPRQEMKLTPEPELRRGFLFLGGHLTFQNADRILKPGSSRGAGLWLARLDWVTGMATVALLFRLHYTVPELELLHCVEGSV